MEKPEPTLVVDLINGFRRSKVMFTAVALGIFDRLNDAPKDAAELARQTSANPGALERLLNACAALGLLRKEDGKYSNEPVASAYLRSGSDGTLAGYILYSNSALYPLWQHLEDAVREGTNRWGQAFGKQGSIFDHFFKSDEAKRDFLMGMHGFGSLSSPHVVTAFDLGRYARLVDLGGATGHLAMSACQRYPRLLAAVFDLPSVIGTTREYVKRAGLEDRIKLIAGDFFKDALPEADLFSLGRILHDWPEEKIRLLLRKIYDRLPPHGALLIAERLLNEDKTGPPDALMQTLNMLVCTEGRERTLSEYTALLREAGFENTQSRRIGAPVDAVLATKERTGWQRLSLRPSRRPLTRPSATLSRRERAEKWR
ncbi:MAG TPA: class I SAM-dependent methyltransferase [Terriglobia bacterium]|nr:class I SAM-dependent methyltransferase [Terriglobia bacterium]